MFVPSWWDNPSEANTNFESTGVAAACPSLGFMAQSRSPQYLMLLYHSQGSGLLENKAKHLKSITSRSALKGVRINYYSFKSASRAHGICYLGLQIDGMSVQWKKQPPRDDGWGMAFAANHSRVRNEGGCEWLISKTYCKELKNKGIIWEQLQRAGICDVSLVAVLKSLLQLFFLHPLSFEVLCC